MDELEQRKQEEDKKLDGALAKLDSLRREYKIRDFSPTQLEGNSLGCIFLRVGQPYWDEKRKVAEMVEFQKFLSEYIEVKEVDAQIQSQKRQNGGH